MKTIFTFLAVVAWTILGLEVTIILSRAVWSAYRTWLAVNVP